MTNKEKLAQMGADELGEFLCDAVMPIIAQKANEYSDEYITECEVCPVRDLCKKGNSGFRTWLEKEAE